MIFRHPTRGLLLCMTLVEVSAPKFKLKRSVVVACHTSHLTSLPKRNRIQNEAKHSFPLLEDHPSDFFACTAGAIRVDLTTNSQNRLSVIDFPHL